MTLKYIVFKNNFERIYLDLYYFLFIIYLDEYIKI